MHLPLSTSQVERLGRRLAWAEAPAEADVKLLQEVLAAYSEVLAEAVDRVSSGVGLSPTSRIKNTGTILEKLDRYGGSWLKSIHDLAGMRVVGSFDRTGQDEIVRQLVDLFSADPRPPKVVDRRVTPIQGYRAVHVIVFPRGVPVEIQVRTRWQHEWAEMFEKLADRVGRGIRYGEPPAQWWPADEIDVSDTELRALASAAHTVRVGTVEIALAVAELIDAVEAGETTAPSDPDLDPYRRRVDEAFAELRAYLERLSAMA